MTAGRRWPRIAAVVLALTATVVGPARAQQDAPLVLDGVTVVDVETGKLVAAQRVVVAGHRIQSVGEARGTKVPKGARVIDAKGK